MTAPLTSAPHGEAEVTTSTDLSAEISPSESAAICRALVTRLAGDPLHRAFDRHICDVLKRLGYSETVEMFLAATGPFHRESTDPQPKGASRGE